MKEKMRERGRFVPKKKKKRGGKQKNVELSGEGDREVQS